MSTMKMDTREVSDVIQGHEVTRYKIHLTINGSTNVTGRSRCSRSINDRISSLIPNSAIEVHFRTRETREGRAAAHAENS
jgi:hypothetical protein